MYSKILTKNANSLLATDFSDEMVQVAKKRLESYDNVSVEKANCFDLSYPDAHFDTVFMANLIHVIPKPWDAIMESKRVLKKGGRLTVISYTRKGMTLGHEIGMIYRYIRTYGKPPRGGKNIGIADAIGLIQSYGFTIVDSGLIGKKSKAIFINAVKN